MKKKRILGVISTILCFCTITVFNSGAVFADSQNVQPSGISAIDRQNYQNDLTHSKKLINTLSDYITVAKDGTLLLNAPDNILNEFSTQDINNAKFALSKTNEKLREGKLSLSKNGTLYDPNDRSIFMQGGNVDSVQTYWWGEVAYMSHSSADAYIVTVGNTIAAEVAGTTSIGAVSSAICLPFGAAFTITGSIGIAAYSRYYNYLVYWNSESSDGIIVSLPYWFVGYEISAQ